MKRLESRGEIGDMFRDNLRLIMTSCGPRNLNEFKNIVSHMISPKENMELIATPSEEDIKKVVFQIGSLKSPGSDGYPARFFQHMWDSIGNDIIAFVQDFFKHKFSLGKINKTFIVYNHKKNNPKNVNDFRPISLCDVIVFLR